ncbi:MAG: cytochrome c nitrite reductase small subunit [Ignavibacteriales bacterium]|nr:cytochrome c nitrite reductase small subunit [Ignavibacteriales bacterium]
MKRFLLNIFSPFEKVFHFFFPPLEWRLPATLVFGTLLGIGFTVLRVSNATSYLSDDPKACVNCHVMSPQYATWQHGSHARVASCNDCHVPHDNVLKKYLFKAQDGLRHSFMFTFRLEPQVIHVKAAGIVAIQNNCQRCHQNLIHNISIKNVTGENYKVGNGHLCWDCHRETPHGRVNSLASAPYARVPRLTSVIPEWMEKVLKK